MFISTNEYDHCCYIVVLNNTTYYGKLSGIISSWQCMVGIDILLMLYIYILIKYIIIFIFGIKMHPKYAYTILCTTETEETNELNRD